MSSWDYHSLPHPPQTWEIVLWISLFLMLSMLVLFGISRYYRTVANEAKLRK